MRIAFFYPSIGLGGQQTAIFELAKQLSVMGHDVSWMYIHDDAFKEKASTYFILKKMPMPIFNKNRYGIFRILNRFYYYYAGAFFVWMYCLINKIDFLIVSNSVDSRVARKVCMVSRVKQFRYIGGSLRQVEPIWLLNYKRMRIDKYVSGYYGWPATFKELASVGVSEHKFINFPFAVNTQVFHPITAQVRTQLRDTLGLPEDVFVIGWVGRIAKNMQVWNTLLLGAELKKLGAENFVLLFVGGGDDIDLLKSQIRSYDLEEQSIVTGWVPYESVNQYINIMDCVPLLEEDPHGGSIVREAMACGRLALSVDGPSKTQREFMKESATVLVPSTNFISDAAVEIMRLMGNRKLIDDMGKKAREYALQHMTFRNQAEVIVDSYKRLLDSAGNKR